MFCPYSLCSSSLTINRIKKIPVLVSLHLHLIGFFENVMLLWLELYCFFVCLFVWVFSFIFTQNRTPAGEICTDSYFIKNRQVWNRYKATPFILEEHFISIYDVISVLLTRKQAILSSLSKSKHILARLLLLKLFL